MMFFKRAFVKYFFIVFAVLLFGFTMYVALLNLAMKKYKDCHYIVKIFNGMGNQFFNYTFGYFLEKETGRRVCYDLSFFKEQDLVKAKHERHEILMLDKYNIDLKNSINFNEFLNKMLIKPLRKFERVKYFDNVFAFDRDEAWIFNDKKKVFVYNYFSPKYYNKYREDLLKMFELKVPLDEKNQQMLNEIKKHKNSVSIHIRRGDYLKYPTLTNVCTIDNYYNKAIDYFKDMDDVHFFVFSDDPEWTRQNLKTNKPTTYVDINDDQHGYFDFELMRNCRHNIIANSTFSLWAAYLNNNEDRIVIAPKKVNNHDYDDKIRQPYNLENWTIIDNS